MINTNWPRWIFASLSSHFNGYRGSYPFEVQSQFRQGQSEATDLFELRMDGPYFNEVSKDNYDVRCTINILVQTAIQAEQFHRIHTMVGQIAAGFSAVQLFRYGDSDQDDQSAFGCMSVVSQPSGESIVVRHFGQVDVGLGVCQATVEATFKTELVA